jgi:hypothetical protein
MEQHRRNKEHRRQDRRRYDEKNVGLKADAAD